ncbi:hypothetical protein JYK14_16290 [Siccirubricoccus sp. KC 17139]|uniref:Amidase n=1 Tax=Siccirubricoccus soli TaxID=2899147 RepID=A0ABT1D754_9PROT|nr:hypothetical protein [Siccirubricoccus soli]MCO6417709.1 hypothetical protein [Siccirubricoccus soli]MCP2683844.1 hypothetical protein [Siccirubricoccus soli]
MAGAFLHGPRLLLALLLPLGACAELRQPASLPSPAPLGVVTADPVREAVAATARAFADRGAALAGQPAAAAEALARLEFLVAELDRNPRYASLPEGLKRELGFARTETRDAAGIAETASEAAVTPALLAAGRALRAGDAARAAAALPAPLFRPGGARSVARLGELGPLPQTNLATGLLAQEVAQRDAAGGWMAPATAAAEAPIGGITFGQSSGITAGY